MTVGRKCEIAVKETVKEQMAQRWFNRFNSGDFTLEDILHSGCPSVWNIEFTRDAIKIKHSSST